MKKFIVLFREPDGRKDQHTEEEVTLHRSNWAAWWNKWQAAGNLSGGSSLTLEGKMIRGNDKQVADTIHYTGTEIIGGFLLLNAPSLDEAVAITAGCPIYEFDGYAEVREFQ